MLMGGSAADPFAWEWDGSNWQPQWTPSPGPREGTCLAYDASRREVVAYGGRVPGTSSLLGDVWAWRTAWPADFTAYGAGCGGAGGVPALAAAASSLPWLGDDFRTQVDQVPLGSGAIFLTGLTATSPQALGWIGLPGCHSLVTLDEAIFAPATPAGTALRTIRVPLAPVLAGVRLFQQALVLDASAPGGATVSNAGEMTVGIR